MKIALVGLRADQLAKAAEGIDTNGHTVELIDQRAGDQRTHRALRRADVILSGPFLSYTKRPSRTPVRHVNGGVQALRAALCEVIQAAPGRRSPTATRAR
jgi:hypothetical protein